MCCAIVEIPCPVGPGPGRTVVYWPFFQLLWVSIWPQTTHPPGDCSPESKKTIKNTHTPQIHFQYLITSYCQGCTVESGCWCFSSEILSWPFTCVVVFSSTLSSSSCVWRRWSSSCSARHSSSACCCSTSISCSDSQRRADRRSRKSCSRSLRVTKSNVTTPDSKGTVAKVNL